VLAAIPEECFKFLVLRGYSSRRPSFDEPMDGVVYGAAASLGFATFENIIYVHAGGFWTALVRAFSAVPAHACDGALMGYCVGQARFNPERKRASWLGLFVAIIFHGFYDYGTKFFSRHAAILNRYYLRLPG
jgi:RsiW-degrading membrane proteinase PrsW (M82 family)